MLFDDLRNWIRLEGEAERERLAERRRRREDADAERTGETLLDLAVSDYDTGLGGRYLLTLVKRNRQQSFPWHRLRAGSPVIVSDHDDPDTPSIQAVVSGRTSQSLEIACTEWPEASRLRVDLAADEVTRRRMLAALDDVQEARGRLGRIRDVLLGEHEPRFAPTKEPEWRSVLNDSQQEAIRHALSAEDVAILHGPPGTGKTTTVAELIAQAVLRGERVLACAPSNTAVDNLLDKLLDLGINAVRLGHPARVAERLREHTLDLLVREHDHQKVVREMLREAQQLYRQQGRRGRSRQAHVERQELRRSAKHLQQDARELERRVVHDVLDGADVLCATTTLDEDLLGNRHFGLLVIDEACQGTEPACWIPLRYAERVVLAGDHCQLPPTVISDQAAREGLARSLPERLLSLHGPTLSRRLTVQYRMHEQIMEFSSRQFYDGDLRADPSVAAHRLTELAGVEETPTTDSTITFWDSAGAGWDEQPEPDGESRLNPEEARLVLREVSRLREAGVAAESIAVITPYAAQVRWLRQQARCDELEIDTVDGFQGREKEVVLISLVRSNNEQEIGFLGDVRRMNVALTRARRRLIVIGDSATIGGHPFYRELLEHFERLGAYRTVWEELN